MIWAAKPPSTLPPTAWFGSYARRWPGLPRLNSANGRRSSAIKSIRGLDRDLLAVHHGVAIGGQERHIRRVAADADLGHGFFAGHAGGIDEMPLVPQKNFGDGV